MKLVNISNRVIGIGTVTLLPEKDVEVKKITPVLKALIKAGHLRLDDSDDKAKAEAEKAAKEAAEKAAAEAKAKEEAEAKAKAEAEAKAKAEAEAKAKAEAEAKAKEAEKKAKAAKANESK